MLLHGGWLWFIFLSFSFFNVVVFLLFIFVFVLFVVLFSCCLSLFSFCYLLFIFIFYYVFIFIFVVVVLLFCHFLLNVYLLVQGVRPGVPSRPRRSPVLRGSDWPEERVRSHSLLPQTVPYVFTEFRNISFFSWPLSMNSIINSFLRDSFHWIIA